MKITFELENEQNVRILGDGKEIGQVFSPAGTSRDKPNAIQVCGFESAFNLWGCGVYSNKGGLPRQDVQLLFNKDTFNKPSKYLGLSLNLLCHKCYYSKKDCKCKDVRIKTEDELTLERLEK